MQLLGQPEAAHHAEALLLSTEWTTSRGGSKHLGLAQSDNGKDEPRQECPRHQDEMNQRDGDRDQRQHHPQAEDGRGALDAIGQAETVEFDMSDGWLGTESSERTLHRADFHWSFAGEMFA